jgi:hypothetical protein
MKLVSDQLFAFGPMAIAEVTHERCSAENLGLKESWFRDAIFASPELVIGPCRAAGLTDDEWYSWRKEFHTDVALSMCSWCRRRGEWQWSKPSSPRIQNSGAESLHRFSITLLICPAEFADSMPDVPRDENGEPVAEADDIREAVSQGDVLVIIASDEVDPRVAKLSRSLLADHFVKHRDLALVDLAVYRPRQGAPGQHFIVPNVRNLVESEPRQVVRVIVQGENPSARVEVERVGGDEPTSPGRQKWDEKRFFENLEARTAPQPVRDLAAKLRELASRFPDSVTLAWGTGRDGSMVLKRNDSGLIEVYGSGKIKFRPRKFARALGEDGGNEYRNGLSQIVPDAMRMDYPRLAPGEAAKAALALFDVVRRALEDAERPNGPGNVEG